MKQTVCANIFRPTFADNCPIIVSTTRRLFIIIETNFLDLVSFKKLQTYVSDMLSSDQDLYICEGFPIPVCHIKRYKRSKTQLRCEGSVGYSAAKVEHYLGFKGHLFITQHGSVVGYEMAAANVDERDILPEIVGNRSGMLLGDKGLIRPSLEEMIARQNLDLQTPLRKNMKDRECSLNYVKSPFRG
eukprot:gene25139-32796_t